MINPCRYENSPRRGMNFWERLLGDVALQQCDNLEKLLAGCEIIVALDDPRILSV